MPKSGGFLERWEARGGSGAATFRPSGRASAGFGRLGECPERDQKLRKGLAHPAGCQRPAVGALRPLPAQVDVGNGPAGQAQLGVGEQDQPGPAVGLLGVADPRGGPVEPNAGSGKASGARVAGTQA